MKLRLFQDKDASASCDIINEGIRDMAGLNEAARAFIVAKNDPATLSAELHSFYTIVCEEAGEILGLGALAGNEIKRVYVKPGAQGRGVGREMMNHLEEVARQRNLSFIEVEAAPTSVPFYEKCGFELIQPGITRHGEAEFNFLIMKKSL